MDLVFLFGNGFDINIGMKTRYCNFYDFYLKQVSPNAIINTFKKDIRENIEDWADLELRLGEYLESLQEDEAILIYNDLIKNLQIYIQSEEEKYSYDIDSNLIRKDLMSPESYLRYVDSQSIKSNWKKDNENWRVRIISFNYTRSLEKLIAFNNEKIVIETVNGHQRYIDTVEHIHGFTNDRMVLGVNDSKQIKNQNLRDGKKIIRRFVKPECNKTYGLNHSEKCASWINMAQIICLYGLSLGETDKIWWNKLAKRLVNNSVVLIIFYFDRDFHEIAGPDYEDKADDIRDLFLSKTQLTDSEKQNVYSKIYVSFSRDIFNVRLSKIEK